MEKPTNYDPSSENHYKELWFNAPVAFYSLDNKGNIKDINQAGVSILGYTYKEMLGQSIFKYVSAEYKISAQKEFNNKIKSRKIKKSDNVYFVKKDGNEICVSVKEKLEYGKQKKVTGMHSIVVDITDQVKAEAKLKHGTEVQIAINKLLQISLKEITLQKKLDQSFDALLAVPWIALEAKGGIWLSSDNPGYLILAIQRNLPKQLLIECSTIPFGRCLCGRTASKGELEFANQVNNHHELKHTGIKPHGHYCIPIKIKNKILGVINFYVKAGHQYKQEEADFLQAASNVIANMIERHRAKEELKKNEERYRNLIKYAEAGVAILDLSGKVIYANPALRKIVGFSNNEATDFHFTKFIHPEDKDMVLSRFKKRLSGNKVISNYEFRVITKTNETRHLSFSGSTIKESGKITGIQAIVRDITENKLLHEKITQSKKHYEQVIDAIQDGIVVVNINHMVISCNKIFADKTGKNIRDIVGSKCQEILPLYEGKILKDVHSQNVIDKVCGPHSVFIEGKEINFVQKYEDKKGNDHFHTICIYPDKDTEGNIYQAVIIFRDITDQKRAEEEIRRLSQFNQRILDTSPVSIVVLNKEGIIFSANALADNLMSRENRKVVGRKLVNTKEIKNNPYLKRLYNHLLKKGEPFYYDNLSYVSEEIGTKKYLNIIAVPLLDANKKVEGAISMAVDNTEAVKVNQKLEYLNQNLETKVIARTKELGEINKKLNQVLELKSKFIADASHELRTPLTVVQGNLDLAIREAEKTKCDTPDIYHTIIDEVGRMSSILSDLTMLTNLDSRNEQIHYEKINLHELIKSVCMSLKVLADQKKITLTHKQGTDNIEIWGDEAKLEKLLLNIVRNAIKYSEAKARVKIWTEVSNGEAIIHVEDNGLGIPEKDLPYIFERFYRVDKARSRSEGGSGLGLAIAKWIVEAHQGKINVVSSEGQGSCFSTHLPVYYKKERIVESVIQE